MNKCNKCRYFDRYYTKGLRQFNLTDIGYCGRRREIVQKNTSCEEFSKKRQQVRLKIFTARTLNNLLTEISEIRKVIEAEQIENEEL